MKVFPNVIQVSKRDAHVGSFCFVPGADGAVCFGVLVQARRPGRAYDFLSLSSFHVLSSEMSAGLDSLYVIGDAFIRTGLPMSATIQTCKSGHLPPLGSIVMGSDGPAIVAMSGRGPESVQVMLDLRTGEYIDNSFYNAIFCTRWQVLSADTDGVEQLLLEVQAAT